MDGIICKTEQNIRQDFKSLSLMTLSCECDLIGSKVTLQAMFLPCTTAQAPVGKVYTKLEFCQPIICLRSLVSLGRMAWSMLLRFFSQHRCVSRRHSDKKGLRECRAPEQTGVGRMLSHLGVLAADVGGPGENTWNMSVFSEPDSHGRRYQCCQA